MNILKGIFGTGTVFGETKAETVRPKETVENITPWMTACRIEMAAMIRRKYNGAEVIFQQGKPTGFGMIPVKVNGKYMNVYMNILPDMKYEYTLLEDGKVFFDESHAELPDEYEREAWEIGIREDMELYLRDRFCSAIRFEFVAPKEVGEPVPVKAVLPRRIEFNVTLRIEYDVYHQVHTFSILEDELVKRKPDNSKKTAEDLASEWLANNSSYIFNLLQGDEDVVSIPAKKLPSDEEVLKLIQIQLSKTGQFELVSFNDKTGDLDLCKVMDEDF